MSTTKGQSRRRKASSADDGPVAVASSNGSAPELGTEVYLDLYRKMNEIRLFEDAAQRGFRTGKVGGYLHLYSGQEAVATGHLHK